MACFMNVIHIIIFNLLGVVRGQVKVDNDDNIEPFSLLCRIYNVAKNPPINYVDLQEPQKIVEEIDTLNSSIWEEKRSNETEHVGNSWEAELNSAVTKETAIAHLSINQMTRRAHKILEEIRRMNLSEEIEKAKVEFHKVIYGEDGDEGSLCHATVRDMDNRSKACGVPGEDARGDHAGNNLVVDFFCLCAQRTEEDGANKVCGFYVGRISHFYGWSELGPWGSSTMWASIKGGCGKHMQEHPKSTVEARHILDQFLKHLKTGGVYRQMKSGNTGRDIVVEGSERKEGMLGTGVTVSGVSDFKCDGKEGGKKGSNGASPGGVCVYYGPESKWQNIRWLKQFQTALETVDAANNQTAAIQRSIEKLRMLQHRAEEIYETTKVILEIRNPVGLPAAFQSVGGNLTAYNATRTRSHSHSHNPYFMPLWVFLFL
ncbi:Variant surface glycoprotein [Trypanosoma congolense IL3000]|uniref:Variant surface glycoprotein n=1 Tax=Trypanosoma congolense (strain IL3000) TaxID=1068625 RepID=F9W3J6_TRYCI|nr:Variant surface glycoprotein [Trypanosoma congolense IL3000]